MQANWDDERRLVAGLDGDRLLVDFVTELTTEIWSSMPWKEDALTRLAEAIEEALPAMQYDTTSARGPAGDPFLELHLHDDELEMSTINGLGRMITSDLVDADVKARAFGRSRKATRITLVCGILPGTCWRAGRTSWRVGPDHPGHRRRSRSSRHPLLPPESTTLAVSAPFA